MRIVYLGNYLHAHCTEVHLSRELERLGHEVVRLQEEPGGVGHRNFRGTGDRIMHLCTSEPTDLFLWTRTWGLPPEATHTWRALESYGVKTASYHLDLYWGLEREARMALDPFWTTQYVFTPDGDPRSAEKFAAANWASKIDLATGLPVENPEAHFKNGKAVLISPWPTGAQNRPMINRARSRENFV